MSLKLYHILCSYNWTGWVWPTTTSSFKTADKVSSTSQECKEYTSNQSRKIERYQHITGCTWKLKDLNKLCRKICNKTSTKSQGNLQRIQRFIPVSFTLSKFKFKRKGLAKISSDIGPSKWPKTNRENRPLVKDKLVEFDYQLLQDSLPRKTYRALHKNADNTSQIKQGKSLHFKIIVGNILQYAQKQVQCIHSVRKFSEFLFLVTKIMVKRRCKIQEAWLNFQIVLACVSNALASV